MVAEEERTGGIRGGHILTVKDQFGKFEGNFRVVNSLWYESYSLADIPVSTPENRPKYHTNASSPTPTVGEALPIGKPE